MPYQKLTWTNNAPPALNETTLNAREQALVDAFAEVIDQINSSTVVFPWEPIPPTVTGSTTQAQVDSLVTILVGLGMVTDGRGGTITLGTPASLAAVGTPSYNASDPSTSTINLTFTPAVNADRHILERSTTSSSAGFAKVGTDLSANATTATDSTFATNTDTWFRITAFRSTTSTTSNVVGPINTTPASDFYDRLLTYSGGALYLANIS